MEGKARHQLIKTQWQNLTQEQKFPFVLMSRADQDRANYKAKISQIKSNLMTEISNGRANSSIFKDVFEKINEEIEAISNSEESFSEGGYEESKQQSSDFSLSTIQRGPFSEEACAKTLFSEEVTLAAKVGQNATVGSGDNYKQTNIESYFKK